MTDSLDGLPAELRKAAQCMQTHYPANKKAHEGECVYWLPAVLVEKEMQRMQGEIIELKAMIEKFKVKVEGAFGNEHAKCKARVRA